MKCPRCQKPLPSPAPLTPEGHVLCPCGARLRPAAPPRPEPAPVANAATMSALLAELRALREGQERIVELLARGGALRPSEATPPPLPPKVAPVRGVLLIDDDPVARKAAAGALAAAQCVVREAGSGNEGLAAIAGMKPRVIVLELDLSGDMTGQDVISLVKATMEWVDIPILLYTRQPVASQRDARVLGADDFVVKAADAGVKALVERVVAYLGRA